VLSRLRKLVFKIRHRSPNARFAESMRRVNRLARLMTVIQQRGAERSAADRRWVRDQRSHAPVGGFWCAGSAHQLFGICRERFVSLHALFGAW